MWSYYIFDVSRGTCIVLDKQK